MADPIKSDITIALDAMGGDKAPLAVVEGASLVLKKYPNVSYLLYGDEEKVSETLKDFPKLQEKCTIIHCDDVVENEDKPSFALRQRKESSMTKSIGAVKERKADAIVSSGNTGALMAIAKVSLRNLPGIDRPAICGTVPTTKGFSIALDLGANVDSTSKHLVQFAVMGDAFAKSLLQVENPSIGLLNIGSEDIKGNYAVKEAGEIMKNSEFPLNFYGYVEGNDINSGKVDVIVSDGFTGNIALKTMEGTAKMCTTYLKRAYSSSILAKLGYLFSSFALKKTFKELDHRNHNGAMFIGINGIVVKSHGGSDSVGFARALTEAIELVKHDINGKIIEEITVYEDIFATEAL